MSPPRTTNDVHPNKGFLLRAQSIFLILGGLYVLVVAMLSIPFFQTHTIYMHALKYPFFTKYDNPEYYGLAPGKTVNLNITTSDNITLGAWFVLSEPYYRTLSTPATPDDIPAALQSRPTILFFHGNAATRAAPFRVQLYSAYSSRLHTNVLSIDYRGFGDSEGAPSEDGLAKDARAAWDWVLQKGAKSEDVLIVGHSLGTAVSARLAVELETEGVRPRGVVLMSPFSSIRTLLDTYNLFGFFPLMKPLAMIPGAPGLVTKSLIYKYDTLSVVQDIKAPVLIAHAENDWDIPHTHSDTLFSALLSPSLPPLPTPPLSPSEWSQEDWSHYRSQQEARTAVTKGLVSHTEVHNFGTIDELSRRSGKVMLLKTTAGGHDRIGNLEGVQDVMRKAFEL